MFRTTLSLLLVLAAPVAAQQLPAARPMGEMHGDCSAFAMDIAREAALWAAGPTETVAASADAGGAPGVTPGVLAAVTLQPQPSVTFTVAPGQDRGAPDRFAGHLRVTIPQAGLWRVAASNGLWFDAVAGGAIVESGAFEMQTGCAAPFKVVVFDLPAGEVALQFNGSPSAEVGVAVLPWTAE